MCVCEVNCQISIEGYATSVTMARLVQCWIVQMICIIVLLAQSRDEKVILTFRVSSSPAYSACPCPFLPSFTDTQRDRTSDATRNGRNEAYDNMNTYLVVTNAHTSTD